MFKLLSGIAAGVTAVGAAGGVATHSQTAASAEPISAISGQRSGSTAPAKANCDADSHWPSYVQGQPDGFDARDDGVYLWHNPSGGWGLRVSHPLLPGRANRVVFTGTITSHGKIGNVTRVKDEKDDIVKVGPKGHALRFRFVDYGGVDGVDFTTTCTAGLQVSLKADRTTIQPQYVHLGDKKVSPGSDPFRIRRRQNDTATVPVPQKSSPNETPRGGARTTGPRGSGAAPGTSGTAAGGSLAS
jgi:hypothetical protein